MNFMTSNDSDKKRVLHSNSDSKEVMTDFDTKELMEELFQSLLHRYRVDLEQSMKGNEFAF